MSVQSLFRTAVLIDLRHTATGLAASIQPSHQCHLQVSAFFGMFYFSDLDDLEISCTLLTLFIILSLFLRMRTGIAPALPARLALPAERTRNRRTQGGVDVVVVIYASVALVGICHEPSPGLQDITKQSGKSLRGGVHIDEQ